MKISNYTLVALPFIALAIGAVNPVHATAIVQGSLFQNQNYLTPSTQTNVYATGPSFGLPTSNTTITWSDTCSTCVGYVLSGSGAATVNNGVLGASASVTVTGSPVSSFLGEADSYAQYTDGLTITGGSGSGVLQLQYTVNGSVGQTGSGFNSSFAYLGMFFAPGVYSQTNNNGIQSSNVDYVTNSATVTFYIPFTYGTTFTLEPIIRAAADFSPANLDTTPFTATSNFFDTATLDSALVFAGTPLSLGSENNVAAISATSGFSYGPNGITTVPEPSTWSLVVPMMGVLAFLNRRRSQKAA
jgi:hypothetical protein